MSNSREELEKIVQDIAAKLAGPQATDLGIYAHEIAKNLQLVMLRAQAGEDVHKELTLLRAQAKLLAVRHAIAAGEDTAMLLADLFTLAVKLALKALTK